MRRSDSGRPTPDTRLSNWRKNFILIATWHAVGGSKSHMPYAWRSDRSRFGSKIGGWSGKRSTKWPPWMPCRCIKCIPPWHISTILTYRPWACTSLGLSTLTLQRASSIDTVFINNCYEQNKQTNERPELQRTNNKLFLTILLHTYTTTKGLSIYDGLLMMSGLHQFGCFFIPPTFESDKVVWTLEMLQNI